MRKSTALRPNKISFVKSLTLVPWSVWSENLLGSKPEVGLQDFWNQGFQSRNRETPNHNTCLSLECCLMLFLSAMYTFAATKGSRAGSVRLLPRLDHPTIATAQVGMLLDLGRQLDHGVTNPSAPSGACGCRVRMQYATLRWMLCLSWLWWQLHSSNTAGMPRSWTQPAI